ncbi:MAG: dUTP diphosphatase [Acidobacteria bacterium]|nr:MAG: dUTP diphosphatase [Acidobacteriota bacterium]
MKTIEIRVKQLPHSFGLPLPDYATAGSSGMDLLAAVEEPLVLAPGEVKAIPTGLIVEIPVGMEIQVRPRSGLALRNSVTCLNTPGTIDADYRGEVKVILANLGQLPMKIERGMRIAQAVLAPVFKARFVSVEELTETGRGGGGFGSTGV